MPVLTLLFILVVIGVLIWAVTTFIPMDGNIKMLIRVVGVIIALFYILNAFGVIGGLSNATVPRIR